MQEPVRVPHAIASAVSTALARLHGGQFVRGIQLGNPNGLRRGMLAIYAQEWARPSQIGIRFRVERIVTMPTHCHAVAQLRNVDTSQQSFCPAGALVPATKA